MHSNDTKDQFVELRATGKSFGDIAEQLNVSKSTLHGWEDERADDIARLRRIQWEETERALGRRLEDELQNLAGRLIDWETLMNNIDLNANHRLRDILFVLRETRREYYRTRAMLMGNAPRLRATRKASPPTPPVNADHGSASDQSEISNVKSEITSSSPSLLSSLESSSPKSNETERFAQTTETQPRNTNDLQQSDSQSFDFPNAIAATLSESVTPDLRAEPRCETKSNSRGPTFPDTLAKTDTSTTTEQCANALPSPSGRGTEGEGQTGSSRISSTAQDQSPIENPKSEIPSSPPPFLPSLEIPLSEIDDTFLGSIVVNPYECSAAVVLKTLEQESAHREQSAALAPSP